MFPAYHFVILEMIQMANTLSLAISRETPSSGPCKGRRFLRPTLLIIVMLDVSASEKMMMTKGDRMRMQYGVYTFSIAVRFAKRDHY
jgi:hypothetical protein